MKETRRFATLFLCAVIAAVFLNGCSNITSFIRGNGNDENNSQSYSISIDRGMANGTVSCNKTSAREGETIVLTITPDNGYELSTITAAVDNNSVTVNGTGNTRTFIMPAQNVTVSATFTELPPTTYSITIADNIAHGSVTANKTNAIEGETVTLTATPADGYQFSAWNITTGENGTVTVTSGTFTMPAQNVTVSASFTELPPTTYSITIADNIAHGFVTANKTSATEGETVTLTATPADGYQFSAWNVTAGESETVTVTSGTFTMPAQNVTVSASFTELPPETYSITVTGGTATVNGNQVSCATAGETITLTATPSTGYQLSAWNITVGESETVTVTSGTFTMPAQNVTVSASFTPINYSISIQTDPNGTITADKQTAHVGDTVTLTINPSTGYQVSSMSVNNDSINVSGSGNIRTFTMPASNVTVSATFVAINSGISITNGRATVNGETVINADAGTTVTITANSPQIGKEFDSWTSSSSGVSFADATSSQTTFTMPENSVTITATYNDIIYSITDSPASYGAVTASVLSAVYGTTITLTLEPNSGYELDTISVTRQGGGTVTLNGFGQNSGDTRWFWMPDANVTVHSTFRPATYTINNQYTYNNNSANFGLLSVESSAEYGSTVTVRATPVTCYHLESLIVNNGDVTVTGSGNTRYFTMPASDVTLTATFETTHIGTKDKPNAIGDIVFNDGTALPVSDYQGRDLTDTEKQNAIAVVAAVASFNGVPDYAITVGLKQEYLPICSNTSQGYTNTQVFSHDGDAGQTRDDICYGDGGITDYTQANYPAIYWAQNYTGSGNLEITSINNDWFIPTKTELSAVYNGKESVIAAINKIGSQYADSFIHENHTYYHTVTQFSDSETHICLVNLEDGNDDYGQYKDSYGPVLVIRHFQCH